MRLKNEVRGVRGKHRSERGSLLKQIGGVNPGAPRFGAAYDVQPAGRTNLTPPGSNGNVVKLLDPLRVLVGKQKKTSRISS